MLTARSKALTHFGSDEEAENGWRRRQNSRTREHEIKKLQILVSRRQHAMSGYTSMITNDTAIQRTDEVKSASPKMAIPTAQGKVFPARLPLEPATTYVVNIRKPTR